MEWQSSPAADAGIKGSRIRALATRRSPSEHLRSGRPSVAPALDAEPGAPLRRGLHEERFGPLPAAPFPPRLFHRFRRPAHALDAIERVGADQFIRVFGIQPILDCPTIRERVADHDDRNTSAGHDGLREHARNFGLAVRTRARDHSPDCAASRFRVRSTGDMSKSQNGHCPVAAETSSPQFGQGFIAGPAFPRVRSARSGCRWGRAGEGSRRSRGRDSTLSPAWPAASPIIRAI